MDWKEIINQSEDFLNDPMNASLFSLKNHPEYPTLSKLEDHEIQEILTEFLLAEGQAVTIASMLSYAPFYEQILAKSHFPSIYG